MTRFLAVLLLLALLWIVVERLARSFAASQRGQQFLSFWRLLQRLRQPTGTTQPEGTTPTSARLVRCAQCQTHVLEERSLTREDRHGAKVFCSEECLREASLS